MDEHTEGEGVGLDVGGVRASDLPSGDLVGSGSGSELVDLPPAVGPDGAPWFPPPGFPAPPAGSRVNRQGAAVSISTGRLLSGPGSFASDPSSPLQRSSNGGRIRWQRYRESIAAGVLDGMKEGGNLPDAADMGDATREIAKVLTREVVMSPPGEVDEKGMWHGGVPGFDRVRAAEKILRWAGVLPEKGQGDAVDVDGEGMSIRMSAKVAGRFADLLGRRLSQEDGVEEA